jgi:hypothetical protein
MVFHRAARKIERAICWVPSPGERKDQRLLLWSAGFLAFGGLGDLRNSHLAASFRIIFYSLVNWPSGLASEQTFLCRWWKRTRALRPLLSRRDSTKFVAWFIARLLDSLGTSHAGEGKVGLSIDFARLCN